MTTTSHGDPLEQLPPGFFLPNQPKYYCGRCEGWYLDEETLIEHTNLYHEYWCTLCSLQIKSEFELKLHMQNIHCQRNRCEACRIIFRSTESAVNHMLYKHSETKDKFASSSSSNVQNYTPTQTRPSLNIRSPHTINSQVHVNKSSSYPVAAPVLVPQNSKNGQYHATLKKSSEYLCAKCNLKFSTIQDTAKHMMSRHNVEIGIRSYRDSGREEIFIIGNKGKIMEKERPMCSTPKNHQPKSNGQLSVDRGKLTLTITPTPSTSNGHVSPITNSFRNSTPILPTGSMVRTEQLRNDQPPPPLSDTNISRNENQITLINHNNQSLVQNESSQNKLPISSTPINNSKPVDTRFQCKYCSRVLSSRYSLNRHLKTVHKNLTQNTESNSTTLRIDRVLTPSEIQAFDLQSTSLIQDQSVPSPTPQNVSNHSDAGSLESMYIEVEPDIGSNVSDNKDLELIEQNNPTIEVENEEAIAEVESDSDMEITVLSEPEPAVPKPMRYLYAQPTKTFLRKKKQLTRRTINKQDIAERVKKISRQLNNFTR